MNTLHQLTEATTHPTGRAKPKPPCATRPDDWDLDIGTVSTWNEAVRTCHGCPILAQCHELATTLTARGMPPRSMIWAGVGYDGHGSPIERLDQHRTRPVEHKRPLRIVRTGPAYTRPGVEQGADDVSASTGSRRTIVLRRRQLAPTGTANR